MHIRKRILEVMAECEPYTAGEIAEELNEPRTTVDWNLRQMADDGVVSRKKHSKRRVTWYTEPQA